jgi:GxxExxY protein
MDNHQLNDLSKKIIGIAIEIHKELGPGFNEKIYGRAFGIELKNNDIVCQSEKTINISFKTRQLGTMKLDYLIENELVIELKSVPEICRPHEAQLLSYLRASDKRLGLILNFGKPVLEIKRLVNRF